MGTDWRLLILFEDVDVRENQEEYRFGRLQVRRTFLGLARSRCCSQRSELPSLLFEPVNLTFLRDYSYASHICILSLLWSHLSTQISRKTPYPFIARLQQSGQHCEACFTSIAF